MTSSARRTRRFWRSPRWDTVLRWGRPVATAARWGDWSPTTRRLLGTFFSVGDLPFWGGRRCSARPIPFGRGTMEDSRRKRYAGMALAPFCIGYLAPNYAQYQLSATSSLIEAFDLGKSVLIALHGAHDSGNPPLPWSLEFWLISTIRAWSWASPLWPRRLAPCLT